VKLRFLQNISRWALVNDDGHETLSCGRQVQIQFQDVNGDRFFVWGRFELYGDNNPVFYTSAGEFSPDLELTIFKRGSR
jgi:hypothetical protein